MQSWIYSPAVAIVVAFCAADGGAERRLELLAMAVFFSRGGG